MKKEKNSTSFVHMGTSLLLVVFLVLTLVTFAVLALSSAKGDYEKNKRFAVHKRQYYEACVKAEEHLSVLDRQLDREAHDVKIIDTKELAFSVPVSEGQALLVHLELPDPTTAEHYYEIKRWQVISTREWEGDQSIQLLPMK